MTPALYTHATTYHVHMLPSYSASKAYICFVWHSSYLQRLRACLFSRLDSVRNSASRRGSACERLVLARLVERLDGLSLGVPLGLLAVVSVETWCERCLVVLVKAARLTLGLEQLVDLGSREASDELLGEGVLFVSEVWPRKRDVTVAARQERGDTKCEERMGQG